jgi:DNA-binding NarL/FixJ family response regulator
VPPQLPLLVSHQTYRICAMIAEGYTNKQISFAMGLTEGTIKVYTCALYQKVYWSRGNTRVIVAVLFVQGQIQRMGGTVRVVAC